MKNLNINYLSMLEEHQLESTDKNDSLIRIFMTTVIAGIAQGGIVAIINAASKSSGESGGSLRYFLMFAVIMLTYIYTKKFALKRSSVISEKAVCRLRNQIADNIRKCELRDFEKMQKTDVHTYLSRECITLTQCIPMIIGGCSSIVMLVFSSLYIAVISRMALVMIVIVTIMGIIYYLSKLKVMRDFLQNANIVENAFFQSMEHMVKGFKQVKMNDDLSEDLFNNHMKKKSDKAADTKIESAYLITDLNIFGQAFFFLLVAAVVFVLPTVSGLEDNKITQLVAAVLFLVGPLTELVGIIPSHTQCLVAANNLENLKRMVDLPVETEDSNGSAQLLRNSGDFKTLKLDEVFFTYHDHGDEYSFELGPIDLEIEQGKITYIVGGNGSGKSTLMKVLAGLYYPSKGRLSMNGVTIDKFNTHIYRSMFSVIFTDFHLFDRLYGHKDIDHAKLAKLIDEMELTNITAYTEEKGFTTTDLSTGQRKRLALVVGLMQERPIYLFDEVAADQDPHFRKYYYEHILPDLRKQGKTIIAVTHDDRYFHLADRVIKMEYGKFSTERKNK